MVDCVFYIKILKEYVSKHVYTLRFVRLVIHDVTCRLFDLLPNYIFITCFFF